ncbi:phosphatidylinositide phosphatase SAC2-like [Stegostoma tigrinum]|uniref:phosphatidylinositide phosphatase SAC2-like n=1 Tax=Stegostoma tigrinum TaxID=3053191 RepID=UPI0028706FC8|nr:phosphatidylinositide phosphatase SAC2-like [Stegostoma tigrinum]
MELFKSQDEYTLRGADCYLSCSRSSGSMEIKAASDVDLSSAVCLGLVEGVVGKFQFQTNLECFLILIQQKGLVGTVLGKHKMYKITKVAVIPLTHTEPLDLKLEFCKVHQRISPGASETNSQRKLPENTPPKRQVTGEEKLERHLLEELVKMFTNSDSFYYSLTYDMTNSAQRHYTSLKDRASSPPWTQVDDRFFWNKYMIRDLLEEKNALAKQWIIPIIQGFVQMEEMQLCMSELDEDDSSSSLSLDLELLSDPEPRFLLLLISRRSRYRGGMRYKRRGVDSDGNVANYVETEQLIYSGHDILSFVQVRGSVPVFWSQQGYRYKPRPKLYRSDRENRIAFQAHFDEQFRIYNKQAAINLVDHRGPEKVIGDAYLKHVEKLNDPRIIYVSFDFHCQCQHRKFENVEILTEGISNIIDDLKWFRMTKDKLVMKQEGVTRVNCLDSLDRTNIVQAAIARKVLEHQLKMLRLLPENQSLPPNLQKIFQCVWANNGDAISRQYAGTAAMKSDFTRTGESKFSGVMKDSYRSANRYYLHHFQHAYRQAVIDLMHGTPMAQDLQSLIRKESPAKTLLRKEQWRSQQEELQAVVQACSSLLIPVNEDFLDAWLLIDCEPRLQGTMAEEFDIVFLLSNLACYFAYVDKDSEITHYDRICLQDVDKIEIRKTLLPSAPDHRFSSAKKSKAFCMQLHSIRAGKSDSLCIMTAAFQNQENSKEALQRIAITVQKVKWNLTGVVLPICVDHMHRSRITEALWALLLSVAHFLTAVVNSVVRACRQGLLKNRKVDLSPGELPDLEANSPEAPLGPLPNIEVEEVSAFSTAGSLEQEEDKNQAFFIYLPQNSRQYWHIGYLQCPDSAASFWPPLPSSASSSSSGQEALDEEDNFQSSVSSSCLSNTSSTSMSSSSFLWNDKALAPAQPFVPGHLHPPRPQSSGPGYITGTAHRGQHHRTRGQAWQRAAGSEGGKQQRP